MVAFILLIYSFLCCYGQSLLPALCMWPTDFSDSRGLLARILQSVAVFSLARQFMVWRDNKSRWYVALFMEAAFKNNSKLALLTKGIKKPTNQMQQTCLITCEECDFSLVHEKPRRVEGVGWGGVWKFFYQQLKLPPNFLWQRCVFLSWRSPFFILSTNLRALKTVLCILSGDNHKFFLGKPKEIAISEGILICVIDLIFFLKCPMLHLTFHLPEKDEVQVLIWSLLKSVVISTGHEAPWDS